MENSTTKHVCLVEDDLKLAHLLKRYLENEGVRVCLAEDGSKLDMRLEREHLDLVVLDLMLPGEGGLDICKRLRSSHPGLGVLILTGKGDDIDRIIGLEMGADDYMAKPCNPRELLARIRAILRRRKDDVPGAPDSTGGRVGIGSCELDLETRELITPKQTLRLTTGEFGVLKALVQRPNRPLSRDQLLNIARGREYQAMDRSIDVHVSKLRKLVEPDPGSPRYLQTVWGMGYVFVP
jgi:DNA-binding response OmpR family regulator